MLAIAWATPGCGESAPQPRLDAAATIRDSAPVGPDTAVAPSGRDSADAEVDPEPDAGYPGPVDAGPAMTCIAIRNCVVRCQTDSACAQRCVDQAAASGPRDPPESADVQPRGLCAADDMECRCEQECFGGGACLDLVDECGRTQGEEDLFCDGLCM